MYKPLPDYLTIKESPIHGLGLYATEDIPYMTELGISHYKHHLFPDEWMRTPLGGFYNHSDEPNCVKLFPNIGPKKYHNQYMVLFTDRDIKAGEEITVKYTMYDPTTR
jgi:SET domain-containing protein